MHILDEETSKKLEWITIVLMRSEVEQMLGYAKQLLESSPASEKEIATEIGFADSCYRSCWCTMEFTKNKSIEEC